MALCSAFSSMGTHDGAVSSVIPNAVEHHAMSMTTGGNVSATQTSATDEHCGGELFSRGVMDSKDLCCDDLQEGSTCGQASPAILTTVTLTWVSYVFDPVKPIFSAFTDLVVPIPWPAIYLLVCSFLK